MRASARPPRSLPRCAANPLLLAWFTSARSAIKNDTIAARPVACLLAAATCSAVFLLACCSEPSKRSRACAWYAKQAFANGRGAAVAVKV